MIGIWSYTVILTYIGLASAVTGIGFAILYAAGEVASIGIPVLCLLISGFCDMFDGRIARSKKNRTEREKQFGIQIDSLCDLICFGALPATIGICLGGNRILGIISAVCLVLAGVVRLAFFNVIEMERRSDPDNKDTNYTGLPITTSALIAPALFCFKGLIGANFATFYQIVLIITAILFISKINIKKPGSREVYIILAVGIILGVVLGILSKF
ncbi:MAG: CDP-alcohol phosphatidyltransferase family protein [Clostridia bacterium]|nr:CDP-alcohol phosphatidyltransferase family protein [Clostridia bacterium]